MVLIVRASGDGLEPEQIPDSVDQFARADRSPDRPRGGPGIGSSRVQRLVDKALETASVRGDGPGRGSEPTIRLPLPTSPAAEPAPAPPRPASHPAHCGRVLVVEDNVDSAEILATFLRRSGHEVRTAYDGPGALEAVAAYLPDVVLLDIGLPGLDGFEVARRLRLDPRLERVRLVAMTGYGQESDLKLAAEAGFNEHLVKPVNILDVRERLTTWLTPQRPEVGVSPGRRLARAANHRPMMSGDS